MKFGIAMTAIITACSGCSAVPVRTMALTHAVEDCARPAGYTAVLEAPGVCAWKRGAECYVQTPRETKYSDIGAGIRACLKEQNGS